MIKKVHKIININNRKKKWFTSRKNKTISIINRKVIEIRKENKMMIILKTKNLVWYMYKKIEKFKK